MEEEITRVQKDQTVAPVNGLLGNCRLGEPIGRGLLGTVYAGLNTLANKPCAIKVFRPDIPGGAVARGRYVHEAEAVAHIGNPNIAETYASGTADGRTYTTMERLEGIPLSHLVREQAPLSRRAYFPLLREICVGLAAAHAYGLAHRHLHPGQVMVRWTGQGYEVKLLDFGTHHLLPPFKEQVAGWQWSAEHAICVAPEQVKNPAEVDSRADVYAVSVMLYEMVTGRVPFLADSFDATLEQVVSDQPAPPSRVLSVPGPLEETIMRGLDKDPRRRIPSVEALLAALDPTAVTGQHQLLRTKLTTTGRHRMLTAEASQEIQLPGVHEGGPELRADFTGGALPPPVPEPPHELVPRVPRNRWWLFVVLAVVVAACGIAVTLLLLGEPEPAAPRAVQPAPRVVQPPRPSPPSPRPAARRPAPAPRPAPPNTARAAAGPARTATKATRRPLTRVEGVGVLEIATSSPKAEVFVNGRFKGRGKLVILPRVPAGTYRIHLVLDKKKTPHRDVQLRPNQRLTVTF